MRDIQKTLDEARERFGPLLPPGTTVYAVLGAVDFDKVNNASKWDLFAMLPEHYLVKKCALAVTSAGLVLVASQWVNRVEVWAVEGVPWASIAEINEPQELFMGDRAPMNVTLKSGGTIRFVAWKPLELPGAQQYVQMTRQAWASAGGPQSPPPASLIAHLGGGQFVPPVRESPPMDPAKKAKLIRAALIGGGALTVIAVLGGVGVAIVNALHNREQRAAADAARERNQRRHAEIEADAARYPAHAHFAPLSTPTSLPPLARIPEANAASAALTDAGFEVRTLGAPPSSAIQWRLEAQGRCGQRITLTAIGPTPYPFHAVSAQCATGSVGTVCAETRVTPRDCVYDPTVREDDPTLIPRRRNRNADWSRWSLYRVLGS